MENNKETRVTLQYGITIDELPEEIEHLSRKISKRQFNRLSNLLTRLSTCSGEDYVSNSFLDTITQIRDCAAAIDAVSMDIESIVMSYIEYSQNPPKEETAESNAPAPDDKVVTVTDELQENATTLLEKMTAFRETNPMVEDEKQKPPTSRQE